MPQLFDLSQSEHTSLAVMLYPDPESATKLAGIEGVTERAEQLHVTLLYGGDATQMTDEAIAEFIVATSALSTLAGPFEANLQGIGRFDGGGTHNGQDVIYAAVDSPLIETLRIGLLDELEASGIPIPESDHGFTPHMTLAYIPNGFDSTLTRNWAPMTVTFDAVSIRIGDLQADFPFLASELTEASRMNIQQRFAQMLRSFARDIESAKAEEDTGDQDLVNRDVSIPIVWDAVWDHFGRVNGSLDDGDSYHWLQDIYVANNGALYAITVQGGKLYRSSITVTDEGTFIGDPIQVIAQFQPVQNQRSTVISRMADGRPIFLSILATAVLNKEQEIDSKALFDVFVDRFKGGEYVNLYHLGKDKTRVGEFRWIGREGNLLMGLWVPDDTELARAVSATLEADVDGRWGNSIEFMPDDNGAIVEAGDFEFRVFESGTFWGSSIVLNEHACSWFTAHRTVQEKVRAMSQTLREALGELINNDELLESELAEYTRTTTDVNDAILQSGAVTRALAELRTAIAAEAAAQNEAGEGEGAQDDGTQEGEAGDAGISELRTAITELTAQVAELREAQGQATDLTFDLDAEAVTGITEAVFGGEEFRTLADSVESLSTQIEERAKAIVGQTEGLSERVAAMEERLAALEADEDDRLRAHDESKPRQSRVSVGWRAGRGKSEGENGDSKNTPKTRNLAELAASNISAWDDEE